MGLIKANNYKLINNMDIQRLISFLKIRSKLLKIGLIENFSITVLSTLILKIIKLFKILIFKIRKINNNKIVKKDSIIINKLFQILFQFY